MRTPPHASLAVAVAAIRELIEQTRASHGTDAHIVQALDFALDGLGMLWDALEGERESYVGYERDCVGFFECAPQACLLTDLNGVVRRANRATTELLGVRAAELLRKPLGSFFPPEQDVFAPGYLIKLTTAGGGARMVHWRTAMHLKAGIAEVEASVGGLVRPDGSLAGLCWLLRQSGEVLDAEIAVPKRAVAVELR
jgi:PAS domain S-box-containing protein